MPNAHICRVDCYPQTVEYANGQTGTAHMMYASEPSSAAGRYQWEQNRAILDRGRRAWRASGQGQSRECRVWDERRREYREAGAFPLHGFRFFALAPMTA